MSGWQFKHQYANDATKIDPRLDERQSCVHEDIYDLSFLVDADFDSCEAAS